MTQQMMKQQIPIFTVSQLNRHVRSYLEHEVGVVYVEGEISNLTKPASGHLYFTLKDSNAQIRCVYFRNRHNTTSSIQNGQHVLVDGQLSLYEARGDYQLIVEHLSDAGVGDLHQEFERLKHQLAAQGLFDAARKKAIPTIPRCIGIITSPTAAALQDILTTLARRFPLSPVLIYGSDVQGKQAAGQLIRALQYANQDGRCDVLILARGGGSMEDLWSFNDEQLVHAISQSRIPVVTGIGHETDFTLADFVADMRAATPTAAAETVVPDWQMLMSLLKTKTSALTRAMMRSLQQKQILLRAHMQQISSPQRLIAVHWQQLDYLCHRLSRAEDAILKHKTHRLQVLNADIQAQHPARVLQHAQTKVDALESLLIQLMKSKLAQIRHGFSTQLATLHAVSPLATLDRGYAIATLNNHVVTNYHQVACGDALHLRLSLGSLTCIVHELHDA